MSDRSLRGAVVLVAVTLVLGLAATISLLSRPAPPPPSKSHGGPSQPLLTPPAAFEIRAFRDYSLLPGAPPEPVGPLLQSRLWTIDGRWWGALVEPRSRELRIYELSADRSTWTDTGVLIDERLGAIADTLWSGGHLYTASTVPGRATASGARLSRFTRDPAGRYVLDPNFPVHLNDGGLSGISIGRDSSGRLWAALTRDGVVKVAYSTGDDAIWAPAAGLGFEEAAVGEDDLAAIVTFGPAGVGLVWTKAADQTVYFTEHRADQPPTAWSEPKIAFEGLPLSGNGISVTAAGDGRVIAAVETAVAETADPGASTPHGLVLVRELDGQWRSALFARVEDHLGRPMALADDGRHEVDVVVTSPRRGGSLYVKSANLVRLEFPAGRGTEILADPSMPDISDPTSTKGPVDIDSGYVVLGFDRNTGSYWHAVLGGPNAQPSPGSSDGASPSPSPSPSPAPAARPGPTYYINDNFDPWPVGQPIANGWELRSGGPPGSLVSAADRSGAGRNARLVSSSDGEVRACKSFSTVTTQMVADVRANAEAVGSADAVITLLRDRSGDVASVRFGLGGTFTYYSGQSKVRTAVRYGANRWYRSLLTVHVDSRTYDWKVISDAGKVVLDVKRIRFREATATGVSQICLQSSAGRSGLGLRFDDVRVSR